MRLDWKTCSQARLSRDARFDGKFFIGVLTSGVYCRCICPARSANECNVRYFPTAAAASEAGFRPCLRCRPECSPGTPGWLGTSSTVSRALRLIDDSALDEDSVDALAERLGITARHLRRLFLMHLGASPSAVAHTRRLHFAKKLIDETGLPMGHVAIAAGFGSVRRFNEAIRTTYHRTPTEIRRIAPHSGPQTENQYEFRLSYRPPYQWKAILSFLASRAIPGVELIEADRYCRSISLNGSHGHFDVSPDEKNQALAIRIQFSKPQALFLIVERIRTIFDLKADPQAISAALGNHPLLRQRIQANPGMRVPGCWDGFELATRAILGQQITPKRAAALAGRIVTTWGHRLPTASKLPYVFPRPRTLAHAKLEALGVSRASAASIRALARAVCDSPIRGDGPIATDHLSSSLRAIAGLEKSTAQYIAMRALRDPDAFPASDPALSRALATPNPRQLQRIAESWRPWRAYAAMYLWDPQEKQPAPLPLPAPHDFSIPSLNIAFPAPS